MVSKKVVEAQNDASVIKIEESKYIYLKGVGVTCDTHFFGRLEELNCIVRFSYSHEGLESANGARILLKTYLPWSSEISSIPILFSGSQRFLINHDSFDHSLMYELKLVENKGVFSLRLLDYPEVMSEKVVEYLETEIV